MATRRTFRHLALLASLGLLISACGGAEDRETPADEDGDTAEEQPADQEVEPSDGAADADEGDGTGSDAEESERLDIVATTSILGDIVEQIVQDDADVTVLMPPGADPHAYEPSAQEAALLREGDLVVANGLMLEENIVSALEAAEAEGANVLHLAEHLDPIEFDADGSGHGHDDEGDAHGHGDEGDDHGHGDEDDGHDDEDDGHGDGDHGHGDEDDGHGHDDDGHDDHDHGPEDPHVWFDPIRMADGVELIADEIAAIDDTLDEDEWAQRASDYVAELLEVHDEIEQRFEQIPAEDRVLVTNHDALGYLAHRYGFEVIGTVVPGSSTQAETDPSGFAELIETVEEAGVDAIFAENTDSTVLADQLATEVVGRSDVEVEVVRIYTDGLGEEGSGAETYLDLLRTDAELIADALS